MEAQHSSASRAGHRRRPLFSAELDYTRQRAASTLHDVADWLDEVDVIDLLTRAEGWARRRPGLFLGGAFAVGLIAARVYKGTSQLAAERAEREDRGDEQERAPGDEADLATAGPRRGRREGDGVPFYPEADLPYRPAGVRESGR